MRELISVIVPVYNVEKYIDKMLTSLCGQTYKELEILLIDDGSTDESGRLCDAWAAKDSRIVAHHQANGGVAAARNKGLDLATGNYLMFADSDDWLEEDLVETLYSLLTDNQADVSMGQLREVYEKEDGSVEIPETTDSRAVKTYDNKTDAGLALLLPWAPYCKLYRRELLEKIRFKNYKIAEDLLFNTDVICETDYAKAVRIERKLYNYLIRENSAMKQNYQRKYLEGMEIEGECYSRLTAVSEKFADINLVGCGVSLVFEKFAQMTADEWKKHKADFVYCKKYAKRMKEALLASSNSHIRISGMLKIYIPDLYLWTLRIRYRKKG